MVNLNAFNFLCNVNKTILLYIHLRERKREKEREKEREIEIERLMEREIDRDRERPLLNACLGHTKGVNYPEAFNEFLFFFFVSLISLHWTT